MFYSQTPDDYLNEAEGILFQYTCARIDIEIDQVPKLYEGLLPIKNPTIVPTLVATIGQIVILYTQVVHTLNSSIHAVVCFNNQNIEVAFGQQIHPLEVFEAQAKNLPEFRISPPQLVK